MRFGKFREFRPGNEVLKYVEVDLAFNFKELFAGLTNLTFTDNFRSFTTTVTVPANSELGIRNQLNEVVNGKIIIRDGGSNEVVDGDTAWDKDFVYLKNLNLSTAITVTVVFFK